MQSFGTDEEIERVVHTYSDTLQKIAYTYLHTVTDAQDVSQEVFLKLLVNTPRFRDKEHEKAWMIRTTINLCKDRLRRAERKNVSLEEALTVQTADADGELLVAVLALPEKYRTVLHLHYYEGYTVREIAQILRWPVGTVATRLSRGRQQLKQHLKGEYENEDEDDIPKSHERVAL